MMATCSNRARMPSSASGAGDCRVVSRILLERGVCRGQREVAVVRDHAGDGADESPGVHVARGELRRVVRRTAGFRGDEGQLRKPIQAHGAGHVVRAWALHHMVLHITFRSGDKCRQRAVRIQPVAGELVQRNIVPPPDQAERDDHRGPPDACAAAAAKSSKNGSAATAGRAANVSCHCASAGWPARQSSAGKRKPE